MDSHNSPSVSCKARSGYGLQTIKVSPAPNNSQPPIVMITPKKDEIDFIDVETPRKPSNNKNSTNIYYYNDKGIGTEDNTKKPFNKEKFKKYCCIGWIIFFLIIVILVIYTFILYAIGVAFLKSHFKISIDGNVLHLNSLDVERYYSTYIDPTQQQQNSRILQTSQNLSKTKDIKEVQNSKIKPKLVKSSNTQHNRLIVDNNNELHLKTKSVESTNAYIDGKSEFFGNVKFGNSTKPVNVEIDNGEFKVKSLTVTDTIDLGKSKFVWDSSDQLNGEQYKNIKLGEVSIRSLNIESKVCSVDASSITQINGVKFKSQGIITSDTDLIIQPDNLVNNNVYINGETKMQTISLGNVDNGGKIHIGLTDKSFLDDSVASVLKLYINNDHQSVVDSYKIDVWSTLKSASVHTDTICHRETGGTIQLKNSLYADQQTITVTNIDVDNIRIDNIECKEINNQDGRCKTTEKLSVNKIIDMNDYNIINVGTINVDKMSGKNNVINMINDLDLSSKNINNVNTIKVDVVQSKELVNHILFNSDIDAGSKSIKAKSIALTDLKTDTIAANSDGGVITLNSNFNLNGNSISGVNEITASTLSANSIITKEISVGSGATVIDVNSDLNLGGKSITAKSIALTELKTDAITAKDVNGAITVNSNLNLGSKDINANSITVTTATITGTLAAKDLSATNSISTPKITSPNGNGDISVNSNLKLGSYGIETSGIIKSTNIESTNIIATSKLKIPTVNSNPACGEDGMMFYNSNNNKLYVCISGTAKEV